MLVAPHQPRHTRYRYVRRNGPYTSVMSAAGLYKLPFGNLPRLILAWVCTEVVRTGPVKEHITFPWRLLLQRYVSAPNLRRYRHGTVHRSKIYT